MPLATHKTGRDLSTVDKITMIVFGGLSLPDRVRQVEAAHDDEGHQTIHASVRTPASIRQRFQAERVSTAKFAIR
jgi:hypothetical protein